MTHRPADDALLADLLEADRPARHMLTPSPAPRPVRHVQPASRRAVGWFSEALYLKVQTVIALTLGLAFSLLLWWVGARCTLSAIAAFGIPVASWGIFAYIIPVLITIVEVGLWPSRERDLAPRLEWAVFLLVDALTTALGAVREVPWLLPASRSLAFAVAFAVGLLIAIVPSTLR